MKSSIRRFRSGGRTSVGVLPVRVTRQKAAAGKQARTSVQPRESKGHAHRKNPRLLGNLLSQGPGYCETYFETVGPEEVSRIFEESYCSSLVNFLLDLKKSTAKRALEMMVRLKKRTFLNVFTLYYYKDYLINPLPMSLQTETGREIPNHYAIVGLPRESSADELRTAHKMLEVSFSADSFPPADRRVGEEQLREIDEAFEILKNPKRRKDLDGQLPNINYFYPRRDQCWFEAVNRLIS